MSRQKAFVAICIGIAAVGIVSLYVFWPRPSGETLKPQLAKLLGISREYLQLNLPPSAGRYPGAILLRTAEGQAVMMRPMPRPSILPNALPTSEMSLRSALSGAAWLDGSLGAAPGLEAKSNTDLDISVQLAQVRVAEYEGGVSALREKLLTDNELQRQRSRQLPVEVIVSAVEAVPTFVIRQAAGLSAQGWAAKSKALRAKLGGSINDKGTLRISTDAAVVIAY